MKTALAAVLVGAALLAGPAAASTLRSGGASHGRLPMLGVVPHHGARAVFRHPSRTLASASPNDLAYLGGWTMRSNTTYAIYWVPSGFSVDPTYESLVNRYLADVATASGSTTNVYSVATQYYDSTGSIAYSSKFGGSYVDTNAFPVKSEPCVSSDTVDLTCVTDSQLQTEIQRVIALKGWPDGESSLFVIFTPDTTGVCYDSADCTTTTFCAYHSGFVGTDGQPVVYAVQPYVATISGCSSADLGTPNGPAVDSALNTLSHEQNEAITDPWGDAWVAPSGDEIADLCAWTFGPSIGATSGGQTYNQLINGHPYSLQEEWSNDGSTCRQNYSSSPPPTSTAAPVVSGTAAVGKTLSTSSGSWTGSPTSYGYQWQRCAADGTGCGSISGATAPTYRLTNSDANHVLRAEVRAVNAGGTSAFVASPITATVVPVPATWVAPAVSGVAAVGRTLSATEGTWNATVTLAYRWLRCAADATGCTTISGATSSTYRLTRADAGHTVEVSVSATNAAATETATTRPTAVVLAAPTVKKLPRILGRPKVGKHVHTTTGRWLSTPKRFRYQWFRCNARGRHCRRIHRASHRAYRVRKVDTRHRLRVRVTALNAAGKRSVRSHTTRPIRAKAPGRHRRH